MSTPFPGMDPYLEERGFWNEFHVHTVVAIANELQSMLDPFHVASLEVGGTTRVRRRVDVLDIRRDCKHVTAIDVLSPWDKADADGQHTYRCWQAEAIDRGCHLVEIDLLRTGTHVLAAPENFVRSAVPKYDYLCCIFRQPRRDRCEIYPIQLRDWLPVLAIPLETTPAAGSHVTLDLKKVIDRVWIDGRFRWKVPYDQPCKPRLSEADQVWATACWKSWQAANPEPHQD